MSNVKDKKPEEQETPTKEDYKYGFSSEVVSESFPKGLNEDLIRKLSAKKNEPKFLLDFRLKAFKHWQKMTEPQWAHVDYDPIDYQDISYYSAPKKAGNGPKSLDEVDKEVLKTFERLGIPLSEQKRLAGVAVDAVFDSVSVATTHQKELEKVGVVFCSISEAVHKYPELLEKHLGTVVPYKDNFFGCP